MDVSTRAANTCSLRRAKRRALPIIACGGVFEYTLRIHYNASDEMKPLLGPVHLLR